MPEAADIFGRDSEGKPRVELAGIYPSGIHKAHNLNRCYRTPQQVLVAAHAIGMGLLRHGGPLQGVTRKEDWQALGYDVMEGDFSPASVKTGSQVCIARTPETTCHPIDEPGFAPHTPPEHMLDIRVVADDAATVDSVTTSIERDLQAGLLPQDIAVVALGDDTGVLRRVACQLRSVGIAVMALHDQHRDQFRQSGHVTLSSIRRAKGNEAYKVYALNLHLAGAPFVCDAQQEIVARNQAFVALTRSRLWCVAIGQAGAIMHELTQAHAQGGQLRFAAFNQQSLKRTLHTDGLPVQEDLFESY